MKLDEFQEKARNNMDSRVLLVAPPGSGKTTVLLAKIEYLVKEVGVAPSRMLVLTFSRSASQNMKERFLKLRLKTAPFFGTIHSLAYREISKQKSKIQLISSNQALYALHSIRRQYLLSSEEVSRAVSDISRERSTGQIDHTTPENFRIQARTAYDLYKKNHQLMDFDDLEEEFLKLLKDPTYRSKLQEGIDWIMVDEFQDLNPIQLKILKLLSEKAKLFCVGDEDQCIYAFRGSDTSAMVNFDQEFSGGKILYLRFNYRCSATIVRHANLVIRNNKERYPKEIINFRQDETLLNSYYFQDEKKSWDYAIDKIKQQSKQTDCVVICRTNSEIEEFAYGLVKKGISFSFLDRPFNRYKKLIFNNVIDYLKYSEQPNGTGLLKVLKTAPVNLPSDLIRKLSLLELWSETDLLEGNQFHLSLDLREDLVDLISGLKKLKQMKPGQAIRYVLYVMGYYKWLGELAHQTGTYLGDLVEEVELLAKEASEFPSTRDFLRYLKAWEEVIEKPQSPERVLLATMHGVKGMEFDEVIILNAYEGAIPHEKSLNEMEAERRLFYVAVTRAKHHLTILTPKTWRGSLVSPSRFIKELGSPISLGPNSLGVNSTSRKYKNNRFWNLRGKLEIKRCTRLE